MLSKRIIATLIAGSFAAQAGAHSYLSDAAGSISDREYQVQASEMMLSENSFPHQLTVFNPDGSSYSLVADAYSLILEPELVAMTSESMPEHLTVFDPDGSVTAYQFTPVDVAYFDPISDFTAVELYEPLGQDLYALTGDTQIILEIAEPIIVGIAQEDSFGNVGFDTEGAPWSIPDHVAAFDEALERTG